MSKRSKSEVPQSIIARLSTQLAALEKRDFEHWVVFAMSCMIVAIGLITIAMPSVFFRRGDFHFEFTASRELFIAAIALLLILNSYLLWRRLEMRRARNQLVSATMQNELIRLQSYTDPLTEVYNRRSLDEMAGRYISRARRTRKPLTFALVDVDRFKSVNTKFGHVTGDFVLAEIAALLCSCVRGSDAVVRYGGDEFLIMIGDADAGGASVVVDRIERSVREWNKEQHLDDFVLRLSIGVAEWRDGLTIDEVLDLADRDMYSNKKQNPRASAWVTPAVS